MCTYELFTLPPLQRSILMRFCSLDEGFKSSSYLTETLLDPELGHASETNKTAFNKALNTEKDFWSWLEGPDNRLRLARFSAAMNGLGNMTPPEHILEGLVTAASFSQVVSRQNLIY
jgi:hypothetical protein